MFVGFGLSAVFPVFHGLSLYGLEQMEQSIGLYWAILQGFLYILGAAIYTVCPFCYMQIFGSFPKLTLRLIGPNT